MKKCFGIWVVAVVGVLLSGCAGFIAPAVRPAEMSQREYAAAGHRAGATFYAINIHQATSADVYIYPGNRNQNELQLNVNGKEVVLEEYLEQFWVMNARHSQDPTVYPEKRKPLILDVNRWYTAYYVIHWGMSGDYTKGVYHFFTTTDSSRHRWQDRFGRVYYANTILLLPGTDQSATRRLNPIITIYPHRWFGR